MEHDIVSLKLDPSIVTPILEKQIQTAIISQIGDSDKLIQSIVKLALQEKVDKKGNPNPRYNSDAKYDFLEVLTANSIRKAAKDALVDWLEENQEKIRNAVYNELDTPERQNSIAKAYADAIEKSLKCDWSMACNIAFRENPDID